MTSISVIMTVFILNFHWRAPEKFAVPHWIQNVILRQLAYLMCIETDYNRRSKAAKHPPTACAASQARQQSASTQLPLNDVECNDGSTLPMYSLNRITYGQIISQMRTQLNDEDDAGAPIIPAAAPTAAHRRQLFAASSVHMHSLPQMQNNHVAHNLNDNQTRRRNPSRSKDRLQEEVIKALTMLISRHEQDENILQVSHSRLAGIQSSSHYLEYSQCEKIW